MRIVAGTAKGRALLGPKDAKTIRPTADRVRETLFNVLGQGLDGERVLDLFAGTGALALEALSRGASRAVLVDQNREALQLCRENAQSLGFEGRVEIVSSPVDKAIDRLAQKGERFELIFADPPYAARAMKLLLEKATRLLEPGGVIVIEHAKTEDAPEQHGVFERIDQRRFGDTLVSMFREKFDPATGGAETPPA